MSDGLDKVYQVLRSYPFQSTQAVVEINEKNDRVYRSFKLYTRKERSTMDAYEFALKMELDGKAYFEKMADETGITGLKTIFTIMAADEQKHYETILSIKSSNACLMKDSTVAESAKNLFEILKGDKSIAASMEKSLDGYQLAKKIEADSIRFYEDAAKNESNATTKQLLLRIAEEEKQHYNIVNNLFYFAWEEYSNRNEL